MDFSANNTVSGVRTVLNIIFPLMEQHPVYIRKNICNVKFTFLMPTKHNYLENPYKQEDKGVITFNEFTDLIVDESILFPTSYGQPNDKGKIDIDGKIFEIIDVWDDGVGVHLISHDTYPADCKGKTIKQYVNWDIRLNHMKYRTALRILAGLAYKLYGATHRINQTYEDYAWIDIEMQEISAEIVTNLETETNNMIKKGVSLERSKLTREDFLKNEELVKQCKNKVPDVPELWIVKIDGLPDQLEMGTVLKNTSEMGEIKLKTNLIKGKVGTRVNLSLV